MKLQLTARARVCRSISDCASGELSGHEDAAEGYGVKAGVSVPTTVSGRVVEVASLLVDQFVGEDRAKLQRQCPERS
jgi:hypothetical protein